MIEVLFVIIFIQEDKKESKVEDAKDDFFYYVKILPFCLLLLITIFLSINILSISSTKNYHIIDSDKAIMYVTDLYYLVLECKIEDDTLIIYKGNQIKLENDNLKSEIFNFEKVLVD